MKTVRDYNLDILGISEIRWTGQGRLSSGGMTILYSGDEEHHCHGIGIILNKTAEKALIGWKPINKRIITARFQTRHAKTTLVQVYAPTEPSNDDDKDEFYDTTGGTRQHTDT